MQTLNQIKSTYPTPSSTSVQAPQRMLNPSLSGTGERHPRPQTSNSLRIAPTSALSMRPTRIRAM